VRPALCLMLLLFACAKKRTEEKPEDALSLAIEGNANVSTGDLRASARRELRAFQEKRRAADAADAAYSMELLLRERGFPHGRVEFAIEGETVVFRVEEGPRAYLGEVFFDRAKSYPDKKLREFFAFEGAGALGAGRPLFRRAEVQAAAEEVERFYLLEGFFRVEVGDVQVGWNDEKTLATVTVPLTEGRRYTIANVEFEGIEPRPLDLVGQPYYVRRPYEAAAVLRGALLGEGRQFADVDTSVEVDHEKAEATVRFAVDPGPKVKLREVRFEGQDRTKRLFLRNRIPIEEMELILQELYDKGINNLYRSGLFSAVRPRLDKVGEDQADLVFGLDEVKARRVDFEVGYGSYELARGAVRYRDDNIFGIGRRFSAELRGSVRSAGIDFRLEDPWLLDDRQTTLDVGVGYLLREEPSFDLQSFRFDVSLRRQLKGPYRLRVGYELRLEEASDTAAAEEEGFIRTAGIFAGVRRDTRDNLLLPRSGSIGDVNVLWSSPSFGAELDFVELDLSYARYVSIGDRTVLAVGGRAVAREILDSRATLPIQERLFLGGESTVRSFFESELGPIDADGEPAGGLTALEAHVEVRRRLWKRLHGAVFYDVGVVSRNALAYEGPPGHAIGAGLRYYLPVGPIRLDFGYNPGRRFAADQPWAIHLSFGFSF